MAKNLFDLFLDSTQDYGIILLDPEGRVQRWSRGAERLFGYAAHEVEGAPAHRIFVPPDRQAGVPEVELQTAAEQGRAEDERWHLRKDGSRFWAVGELSPIRDGGEVIGFVKILRDRTVQREAEETIREERHALEVLNRAGSALALETDLQRLVQIRIIRI